MPLTRRVRGLSIWLVVLVVLAAGVGIALWMRKPKDVYWIGFVDAPPILVRQADGRPSGFVYDVIAEAARREGLRLEWIECGQDGVAALRTRRVDLWALTVDFPERRAYAYFTDPWLRTEPLLLIRSGDEVPGPEYSRVIGHKDSFVFSHIMKECFPVAREQSTRDYRAALLALKESRVDAVLYTTWDSDLIEQLRQELDMGFSVKVVPVPGRPLMHCVASTFEQKAGADRLRHGLDQLAQDGTLAMALRRTSWHGIAMIQPTFEQLEMRQWTRWLAWFSGSLLVGVIGLGALAWFFARMRHRALRAEAASAIMVERYTLAAQATNDAIWDWQPPLDLVEWGQGLHDSFGYDPACFRTSHDWWKARVHPEDVDRVVKSMEAAFERMETHWSADYRFQRTNGSHAFVHDSAHVVYDPAGKPIRVVGAIVDQSQRLELEQQLHQAQKMEAIGRLAGGVAHDFNNLLTVLRGYSDLLMGELEEGSRPYQHARQVGRVTERGGDLVRQLLAFSRRQIIQPRPVDLNELLREDESMLRSLLGEDVDLLLDLAPELPRVMVDPTQWNQVIVNLAVNARDAMPQQGGQMRFETTLVELDVHFAKLHSEVAAGIYVRLLAADNGQGIEAEVLGHIFEPFFTTKAVGQGTGLGLATVYGIVKQSHGFIEVASSPGKGTTFKVYLPICEHPDALAEPVSTVLRVHAKNTARVLVVEDQAEVRSLTAEILRNEGFEVEVAEGAEQALALIEGADQSFDLLLTDVVMPGMHGRALADRVRTLRPGIRVLFMSGYAEDLISHRGVLESGLAFLPKPFSAAMLLEKIHEVLEG